MNQESCQNKQYSAIGYYKDPIVPKLPEGESCQIGTQRTENIISEEEGKELPGLDLSLIWN